VGDLALLVRRQFTVFMGCLTPQPVTQRRRVPASRCRCCRSTQRRTATACLSGDRADVVTLTGIVASLQLLV
jgi:hypothetical protein